MESDLSPDQALGLAIRMLRTARRMRRTDLAREAGISYPFLSEVESGRKRPSANTQRKVADALGVPPHTLMEMAETQLQDAPSPRWFSGESSPPMAMGVSDELSDDSDRGELDR